MPYRTNLKGREQGVQEASQHGTVKVEHRRGEISLGEADEFLQNFFFYVSNLSCTQGELPGKLSTPKQPVCPDLSSQPLLSSSPWGREPEPL